MGAGASSGTGPGPAPVARGGGGGSVTGIDRNAGRNSVTSVAGGAEAVGRGGSVVDITAKQGRHVVIQAAEPKAAVNKGQKGGLLGKLRSIASQNNSPAHSPVGSRMASRAGSVAGSHNGSEKSQMGVRSSRRDDYDVDSDDEDLEGFIYDDDSTSEDEREDYVNAFSRRKKLPKGGDDYSEYEGAAVRALTAGGGKAPKSSRRRQTESSSQDEDGDDEWDPEEERISKLRQQKRQQDRARAEARSAAAAAMPKSGYTSKEAGPGPSTAAARARAAQEASQQALQQQQQQQQQQQARMVPQPPTEPPLRGTSGNLRRSAAGNGVLSHGSSGGGAAPGPPDPGQAPGVVIGQAPGPSSQVLAGRGQALRPAAPPAPAVNYGASASSQYWQAKRTQADDVSGNDGGDGGAGLSRLEQLAALQKKRLAQADQEEDGRGKAGGVRWQTAAEPPPPAAAQPRVGFAPAGELGRQRSAALEADRKPEQLSLSQPMRTSASGMLDDGAPVQLQLQPLPPPAAAEPGSSDQQRQQRAGRPTSARKELEGVSFMTRLAPPGQRGSGNVIGGKVAAAGGAPASLAPPAHPAPITRNSDVTDFDVDEVLSSLAPGDAGTQGQGQGQPQQWAGGRPQPPPSTPPQRESGGGGGLAPQHRRSIRAVQSDFISMSVPDTTDSQTDVTARMLSLPLAASRPPAVSTGPTVSTAPPAVTGAAAPAVSRFARMGANMVGPNASSDGSGPNAAPEPAWGGSGPAPHMSQLGGSVLIGSSVSQPQIAGTPVRRPRRGSNVSSDGTPPPMKISLSAPAGDTSSGGSSGSMPILQCIPSTRVGSPRVSLAGCEALVLPSIRPGSGARGSECGGLGNSAAGGAGAAAGAAPGRSRFANVPKQQEPVRSSAPVLPTVRDYDSDSALTRSTSSARRNWNGANGGAIGVVGLGASAMAPPVRSRLGQVGA